MQPPPLLFCPRCERAYPETCFKSRFDHVPPAMDVAGAQPTVYRIDLIWHVACGTNLWRPCESTLRMRT